jgi:hypothetical protein
VGVSTDYSAVGLTNTAIGAANPSSGAFTSLSSSSTTTLNGTTVPASKTLVVTTDKLSALAATTSAELAGVISDETGSGALVFANSPTLVTPALGTPSSGTVTNLTGTASININGTVGATTPSTVAATTITGTDLTLSGQLFLGSNSNQILNFATNNLQFGAGAVWNGSSWVATATSAENITLGSSGIQFRLNTGLTPTNTFSFTTRGTIDVNGFQGAIGATTPSTGAFTTGSFSGTLFAGGVTTLRGANVPVANNSGFLVVGSSDAAAADLGGSIGFQANTTSLSNYPMGNISARLIATGAGVYRSYMAFATTDAAGSVAERMRLTDTGLAVTGASTSTGATRIMTNNVYYAGTSTGGANQNLIGIGADDNTAIVSKSGNTIKMDAGGSTVGTFSATGLAVTGALSSTGALAIGNTVATAVAVASTHKVTIVIGGTTYYLLATNV